MWTYLSRLLFTTLAAGVWGIGGGFAVWFMWQYVAGAYETWEYFPRAMFIIPGSITLVWGATLAGALWFLVNCLLNTKSAQGLAEAPTRPVCEEARTAIMDQAARDGESASEKEADELHAWLNAAGVSDERIIGGWVDDLATEAEAVYDLAGRLHDTEGLGHERALRLAAMQHGRPPSAELLGLAREDPDSEDTRD